MQKNLIMKLFFEIFSSNYMRILFQIPFLETIYAGRTIYFGYKHAFEDMGHDFQPVTALDDFVKKINDFSPDILITSLNTFNLKYMDLSEIKKKKGRGMKVFVNTPFWNSPFVQVRLNETRGISHNKQFINLIKSGDFGDVYYNVCEQGDPRMAGFEKATGYPYFTIPLAADKHLHFPEYTKKYETDISYIGTRLPGKINYFNQYLYPLRKSYNVKLYGQDWKMIDRIQGVVQKAGQYFNIPIIRSLQKAKLNLEDERRIYASSKISINIHEDYQLKFGGDCNERTFKIPACGGFEITDNVACIKKYFKQGKEIIIAENKQDWFEKIEYFYRNPEKRLPIIEAGMKRVQRDHTYHNRVQQMVEIYTII